MGQADPNHLPEEPILGGKPKDYPTGSLAEPALPEHALDVKINTDPAE